MIRPMGTNPYGTFHASPAERRRAMAKAKAAGFASLSAYVRHLLGLPPLKRGRPPAKPARRKPPRD